MKDVYNHDIRYKSLLREIKTFNPKRKNAFIKYNRYCVTRNLSIARRITLLNCLKAFLMDDNLQKPTRFNIYTIIQKIDNNNKSPNTKRDYKLAYRSYLSSLGTKKDIIELVAVGNPTGIYANRIKPKIDELLNIWFKKRKELNKLKEKN